jgi:imidazole glycerol phosphate synthase, glutamine amidotransferase subunit
MRITIIDYGMGNLHSVKNALNYIGVENIISGDTKEIEVAEALILPGVGAFPDAMETLMAKGLDKIIIKRAKEDHVPLLGICLGMQLLLDNGFEFKEQQGLSLISGSCIKITAPSLKIPHIGWNDLVFDKKDCPLLHGIKEGSYVYFVHSYRAELEKREDLIAHTQYGEEIPALIGSGNIFGAQFHPEKSESVGLSILKNFAEYCNSRNSRS